MGLPFCGGTRSGRIRVSAMCLSIRCSSLPNDISGLASWASSGLLGIAQMYKPSVHVIPFPSDKTRSMIALTLPGIAAETHVPDLV